MKEKVEKFQNSYKYKVDRISAYLIDLLIVAFLVTFLVGNTITNPFYNSYRSACDELREVTNEASKDVDYSSKESMDNYVKKVSPYNRTCHIRSNYASYVWYTILIFFYFGLFAYLNDGQTLGKKMFKLKVVNNSDGKSAKFYQLMIRNIFGGALILGLGGANITMFLSIGLPLIKNPYNYTIALSILRLLSLVLDTVFIGIFIFNKNGRTLDDFIGKTKVISINKKRVSKEN